MKLTKEEITKLEQITKILVKKIISFEERYTKNTADAIINYFKELDKFNLTDVTKLQNIKIFDKTVKEERFNKRFNDSLKNINIK